MPKVSILIPIYNVEKYLKQCLDSVVNQTLKDIEIICINDGSTDNSLAIINEFAAKDSRIKVIDKKNTGYGHSMNCGLKLAQGEYIGIVESDDFADLNMFEVLYNKANKFDAEIVKSNYFVQVGKYSRFNEALEKEPYEKIFSPKSRIFTIFHHPIVIWCAIYKREFLLKNDIYFNETPGASYQDVSFWFKNIVCAERIYFIKDAFLHYRIDNPSASMKSKQKVYCIFDEFNEMEKFLSQHDKFFIMFKRALSYLKFRQCDVHYQHIDDSFKFVFFQRMFEEFSKNNEVDYIDKSYWNEESWADIQRLLADKEKYFYYIYERSQRRSFYISDFFQKIKQYDNLYLYGAGRAAQNILLTLFQHKLHIEGLLVSNMQNNPLNIMDIPVISLSESNINKDRDAVLISIKEENQYEILYKLQSEGYKNTILMTRDLRAALR